MKSDEVPLDFIAESRFDVLLRDLISAIGQIAGRSRFHKELIFRICPFDSPVRRNGGTTPFRIAFFFQNRRMAFRLVGKRPAFFLRHGFCKLICGFLNAFLVLAGNCFQLEKVFQPSEIPAEFGIDGIIVELMNADKRRGLIQQTVSFYRFRLLNMRFSSKVPKK